MRVLYFDIDGTLLTARGGRPKKQLARGAFEAVLRSRAFDQLVCVGSIVDVLEITKKHGTITDNLHTIFRVCKGVFADEAWFRQTVNLIKNSHSRATEVNLDHDWWYLDDLAEYYFKAVDLGEIFERQIGTRILIPDPEGDGSSILEWLDQIPSPR